MFLEARGTVQERSAKLRQTVAELEGFSYGLAYDMRAPLWRAILASSTAEPTGARVAQVARGLVDGLGGVLAGKRYLLQDRGAVFTERFRTLRAACGGETVRTEHDSSPLSGMPQREPQG